VGGLGLDLPMMRFSVSDMTVVAAVPIHAFKCIGEPEIKYRPIGIIYRRPVDIDTKSAIRILC
jgi:hypothetical protein